ncbi:glycoside hydrolase family 5 protein [Streptomyces rimosus]|uniref:glycoside hydrolase family 5 protein n=1 Tax=Streptomyces rimosus TaxID=1927 RepID=UPI000518A410|nr:glycoside hydrolase family 5 protein [Streptomyces rimosus]
MRPRPSSLAATVSILLLAPSSTLSAAAEAKAHAYTAPGLHVKNGRLVEKNGADFVFRGVNHSHAWHADRTGRALSDIKRLGANSVRIVLSSGARWTKNDTADVRAVISRCKANRLICVLEVHDTTGYGEQAGAVSLSRAADYWIGVRSALRGEESHVVVNIGNEPYGNNNTDRWAADTKAAIARLRAAGLHHALMADGPNWGQDWSGTMQRQARSVFDADPDHNTLFSVHMYGVYNSAEKVKHYLDAFTRAKLPLIVGEFGHYHPSGDTDEDTIMARTKAARIGYLGWSWSGNSGEDAHLDLSNHFDAKSLTPWGQRLFHGADGIKQTAREAAVYR